MRRELFIVIFFFISTSFLFSQYQDPAVKRAQDSTLKYAVDSLRYMRRDTVVNTDARAYLAIRIGLWLTGDVGLRSNTSVTTANESITIEYGGGFGMESHYNGNLGNGVYWDLALGGWYSSSERTELIHSGIVSKGDSTAKRKSFSLIFPLTVGLSYYIPTHIFLRPYIQAGVGVIGGYSSIVRDETSFGVIPLTSHVGDEKFQVSTGGFIGLGSKILLNPTFGLDVSLKYLLGKFSDPMYSDVTDFTGLQLTIGIAVVIPYERK